MTQAHKTLFAFVFTALIGFFFYTLLGDNGLLELKRLHKNHQQLLVENEQLVQENSRMYRTIDRLQNDPAFIENVARQELGMVRSDELVFKFKDNPKAP